MENVTTPRPAAGLTLTTVTLAATLLAGAGHVLAQDAAGTFDWSGAYAGVHIGGAKGEASGSTRFDLSRQDRYRGHGLRSARFLRCSRRQLAPVHRRPSSRLQLAVRCLGRRRGNRHRPVAHQCFCGDRAARVPRIRQRPFSLHCYSLCRETDWLLTLRPRIGYTTGNLLIFGTAGLALSKIDASFSYQGTIVGHTSANSASGTASKTVAGWTIGGGIEAALSPNWIVKADYLYANFDSGAPSLRTDNLHFNGADSSSQFRQDLDLHFHIGRIGLSYKF